MSIFILICCIVIPIVMIVIGILYRLNLFKESTSILDLLISLVMMFSGISQDNRPMYLDKKIPIYSKKRCGIIWIISGIVMLICVTVLLLLNISQINSILDSLLDIEFMMFTTIFITTEYFLKKSYIRDKIYN